MDELIEQLATLVEDMAFDYDRFSQSGKETYDDICLIIAKLKGGA